MGGTQGGKGSQHKLTPLTILTLSDHCPDDMGAEVDKGNHQVSYEESVEATHFSVFFLISSWTANSTTSCMNGGSSLGSKYNSPPCT